MLRESSITNKSEADLNLIKADEQTHKGKTMSNEKPIGERIKEIRKTLHLTQKAFGEQIGFRDKVAQVVVAKLESGKHKPSYETLRKIIKAFPLIDSRIFFE